MILAPEGNRPPYTVVDCEKHPENRGRRFFVYTLYTIYERLSFNPIGALFLSMFLGPTVFFAQFVLLCLFPYTLRRWKHGFLETINAPHAQQVQGARRTDRVHEIKGCATDILDLPFSKEEGAKLVARTFLNVGCVSEDRFAPLVVFLGHGSRTVNNPFDAAHNCGACGGREGAANARLMAKYCRGVGNRRKFLQ